MVSVLLEYIIIFLAKQSLLCLILLATYYAQNYAGITGWSLPLDLKNRKNCKSLAQ